MQKRLACRGSRNWVPVVRIALALLLAMLLLSGAFAPRVTDAAPPAQTGAKLTKLIQEVTAVIPNLPLYAQSDVGRKGAPLTSPLRYSYMVDDVTAIMPVYITPSSLPPDMNVSWRIDASWLDQPRTAAEVAQAFQSNSTCMNYVSSPYGENSCLSSSVDQTLASTGLVYVATPCANVQVETGIAPSNVLKSSNSDQAAMRRLNEKYVQAAATILLAPVNAACGSSPPAAAPLSISHGCSYNEPGISQGQVVCVANASNASPGAEIIYKWTLDGEIQTETGSKFMREDKDLSPGEHTLVIAATEDKSSPLRQASSSYSFTKAGADLSVTVLCALRSDDDRAVACYADPKNAPEGAVLSYEWTWNKALVEGESIRTLYKEKLDPGVYTISVRAKDSKNGKYTAPASTTVTIGTPAQPPAQPPAAQPPAQPPVAQPPAQPPVAQPPVQPPAAQPPVSSAGGQVDFINPDGRTTTLRPAELIVLQYLLQSNRKTEIRARCENLKATVSLMWLAYAEDLGEAGNDAFWAISRLVDIKCDQLLASTTPRTLAMAGDPARALLALPLAAEPAVQLKLELRQGSPRMEVVHDAVALEVDTGTATITSRGKNVFGVAHDPNQDTTFVRVDQGTVNVYPRNPSLSPFSLQPGQIAQVTQDNVSPVVPPNANSTETMDSLLPIALVGGVGLIALIGIIAIVLLLTRRAPGSARVALASPPPGYAPPPQSVPPPPPLPRSGPPPPSSLPERAPTSGWTCTKCGGMIRPGKRYCSSCGTPR